MSKLKAFQCALGGAWSVFKGIYYGLQTMNEDQLKNLETFSATVTVNLE